jgi:hypothetical protein
MISLVLFFKKPGVIGLILVLSLLLLIKTCFCAATITMREEDRLDPMFFLNFG